MVVFDVKRFIAFISIVAISFMIMIWTSPNILKNMKLGLDLKGGFEILYEAEPIDENQTLTKDVLREAARSIESRANASKVAEPDVTPEGNNRIRVKLAGVENPEELREILKKPAVLTFRAPDGTIMMRGNDFVEGGAKAVFHPETGVPMVTIKLKDAQKFYDVTKQLTNSHLGIFLDDEMISNPRVNYPINSTEASIEGMESFEAAERLAGIINLGALPVKLTELYTQSVGATLGQLSLEQTVKAGIVGSIAMLLFMLVFYRLPGVISCITLIIYTWLLLLIFYWMKATLTLPGIAAFILGIGMAVDANIITAERIKEEIRSGKTLLSSVRAGSRNSLTTIMDANLTTIVAGIVLYFIGTGSIQGFALILIFSILVSIITNVFLSRFLLQLLVRTNVARSPRFFGVKEEQISEL